MTPPTVTDTAIEMMLRERGGAMVPSGLENAIVAAVRAESARAGTPRRRWLARPAFRPALAFALAGASPCCGTGRDDSWAARTASPCQPPSRPRSRPPRRRRAQPVMVSSCSASASRSVTARVTLHDVPHHPPGWERRATAGRWLPGLWQRELGPHGRQHHHRQPPLSSSTTQIYEVAADGGAPRPLLTLADGYEPAFSPDGSQMAYEGLGPGATASSSPPPTARTRAS